MSAISEEAVKAMPERIYAVKKTEGSNCVVSFDTPSLDYNVEYVRADLALPHLPGVGVKKLEWQEPSEATNGCWIAKCEIGTYSVVNENGWYAALDEKAWGSKEFEWTSKDISKDTRQTAFDVAQADYEARILSALEPSVCQTCNGRGIIGGLYRVGDGDVDGWEEPCPACEPSTTALEAGRRLEEFLKENEDSFFDSEIQTVKDAINALSTLPVSQPYAGRAAVLEEARRQAIEDVLGALTAHELYQYRPKAFQGFIDYARSELLSHPQADKPSDDGAQGEGWLPMKHPDTPRDGTEILAWRKDCGQFIASYTSCSAFPMSEAELDLMDEDTLFKEDWFTQWPQALRLEGSEVPTHWRPLPTPPSSEVA